MPDKHEVGGSSPLEPRAPQAATAGDLAQLGERLPCTQEVVSSSLIVSSTPQRGVRKEVIKEVIRK